MDTEEGMINIFDLAEYFQTLLNANNYGQEFDVHTPLGYRDEMNEINAGAVECFQANKIYTLIYNLETDYSPIPGVRSSSGRFMITCFTQNRLVEFQPKTGNAVKKLEYEYVLDALDELLTSKLIGKVVTIPGKSDKVVLLPNRINPIDSGEEYAARVVLLSGTINIAMTENGLFGNDVKYQLKAIGENTLETPLALYPVNRTYTQEYQPSAFQNISEDEASSIIMQNTNAIQLGFIYTSDYEELFKAMLAEDGQPKQNVLFRIATSVGTLVTFEHDYILSNFSLDSTLNSLLSFSGSFVRANEGIGATA